MNLVRNNGPFALDIITKLVILLNEPQIFLNINVNVTLLTLLSNNKPQFGHFKGKYS